MSIAMHSGSQPPVFDTSTVVPECDFATLTSPNGRSVMASACPARSAFTWEVASLKSVIVTWSKYGPSPQ